MSGLDRSFGEIHFGATKLGNISRTKRLVQIADALVRHPGGTLPSKLNDPSSLKATYRLLERPEVSHASVLAAHQEETLRRIEAHEGPLLAICDTTELDYSGLESLADLGPIGNGLQRGYLCHNVLIVDPQRREAIGLAQQILHTRELSPAGETKEQIRVRQSRESRLWPRGTESLPGTGKLIVVCDRGGDTFEELEHEARSGRGFVIRSRNDRKVHAGHGSVSPELKLHALSRAAHSAGSFRVEVASTAKRPSRTATVCFAYSAVELIPPRQARGHHSQSPLPVWIVRAWELKPPRGVEPLEWFLLTNQRVDDAMTARRVIEYYECRWTVEEYHKAQKTGCDIEDLQFCYAERLEPMIALLSVVAVTLLQLRDASRRSDAQTTPANEIVAQEYVDVLSAWRHGEVRSNWNIHEFFLALARLGGHQNRKRDKRPGWLVLWRGWSSMHLLNIGFQIKRKKLG